MSAASSSTILLIGRRKANNIQIDLKVVIPAMKKNDLKDFPNFSEVADLKGCRIVRGN